MAKIKWFGALSVLMLFWLIMPGKAVADDDFRDSIHAAIKMSNSGDYQGAIRIFTGLLQKADYNQNPELHFHLGSRIITAAPMTRPWRNSRRRRGLTQTNPWCTIFPG